MPPITLRQRAYRRLREKFLAGELVSGMTLSENQLAKELGMSRTPIREAIRQMEMEGLLDYAPRYGAVVRTPDARELQEMYAVREALESYAAAAAAESIRPETLLRLRELWERMQQTSRKFDQSGAPVLEGDLLNEYLTTDLEFHRLVVEAAGNRYLSKIVSDTRLLVRVFTSTFWRYDRERLDQANRFHRRLLESLQSRDAEAARAAAGEAMRVARENAQARHPHPPVSSTSSSVGDPAPSVPETS